MIAVVTSHTEEIQEKSVLLQDQYPISFKYSPPGHRFYSTVSIKGHEEGAYLVGYVQYITDYKLEITYKKNMLTVGIDCPISDAGVTTTFPERSFPEDSNTGAKFVIPCPYPFTAPPKEYEGNPSNRTRAFVYVETSDAPQGSFNWNWPALTDPHGIPDNPFIKLERSHNFVTCLVLWDKTTQKVVCTFSKIEWTHKIEIMCDPNQGAGNRLTYNYDAPQFEYTDTGLATFVIPPKALGPPCANEECKRKFKVVTQGQSRLTNPSIHTNLEPKKKWPTVAPPQLFRTRG